MRRMLGFCALAISGDISPVAIRQMNEMNGRRCMSPPSPIVAAETGGLEGGHQCPLWVVSGHMQCKGHVRFPPNSDRESRHPQTVMSALPPKADMCSALAHVCFGPKADIDRCT